MPWEKHEGSGEGFLECRDSAEVRLYDMPFLGYFLAFFYIWSPVTATCEMPWQGAFPHEWTVGGLTTFLEVISTSSPMPEPTHAGQKVVP